MRKQVGDYLAQQIQPRGSSMFMKNQSYPIDLIPFQMMFLVEKVKKTHQMWDIWFPDISDKTHHSVHRGNLGTCGPVNVQPGHFITSCLPRPQNSAGLLGTVSKTIPGIIPPRDSSLFRAVASLYQWFGWQSRQHFTICMGFSKMEFIGKVNSKSFSCLLPSRATFLL